MCVCVNTAIFPFWTIDSEFVSKWSENELRKKERKVIKSEKEKDRENGCVIKKEK